MMVLADTSIWSVALRRTHQDLASIQKQQARILQELISEGRVQLLGVVRQELLSGIRRIPNSSLGFENICALPLRMFPLIAKITSEPSR